MIHRTITTKSHPNSTSSPRQVLVENLSEITSNMPQKIDIAEVKNAINELTQSIRQRSSITDRKAYYPVGMKFELLDIDDLGFAKVDVSGEQRAVSLLWAGYIDGRTILLGRVSGRVYYSDDGGENWVNVCVGGRFNSIQWGLVVPGKSIIICDRTQENRYVIDHSGNFDSGSHINWSRKVIADAGTFRSDWGLSHHGDVIAVSTYGSYDAENPPRFVYLSRDAGVTWKTIEVVKVEDMVDPGDFHLHDVEFDPWTKRLWVSNGDRANSALRYSDDWGETWHLVEGDHGQPTSIIALPDRILFGRDATPAGWSVWYKPQGESNPEVKAEDIHFLYSPVSVGLTSNRVHFIPKIHHSFADNRTNNFPYDLMGVFSRSDEGRFPGVVVASPDGERWFVLFKSSDLGDELWDAILSRPIGPVVIGDKKYAYISFYHETIGGKIVRITYPRWQAQQ